MKKYLLMASLLTFFISGQAQARWVTCNTTVEWKRNSVEVQGESPSSEGAAINDALQKGCAKLCNNDVKCIETCKASAEARPAKPCDRDNMAECMRNRINTVQTKSRCSNRSISCDLVIQYYGQFAGVKVTNGKEPCMELVHGDECAASNSDSQAKKPRVAPIDKPDSKIKICPQLIAQAKNEACQKLCRSLEATQSIANCQKNCEASANIVGSGDCLLLSSQTRYSNQEKDWSGNSVRRFSTCSDPQETSP